MPRKILGAVVSFMTVLFLSISCPCPLDADSHLALSNTASAECCQATEETHHDTECCGRCLFQSLVDFKQHDGKTELDQRTLFSFVFGDVVDDSLPAPVRKPQELITRQADFLFGSVLKSLQPRGPPIGG